MREIIYNRQEVFNYAKKWAFARNPGYYDFSKIGGDCTNYASQCLFAGCGVMNYTPDIGWFYKSVNSRSASWTGVEYFYNFLVGNTGVGPYAEETDLLGLEIGDFVQFGSGTGDFYHTPVVVGFSRGEPLLSAHSYDAFNKPLSAWSYRKIRCLHILGARRK